MASVRSPRRADLSVSDSGNNQGEGATINGVSHADEKKPDFADCLLEVLLECQHEGECESIQITNVNSNGKFDTCFGHLDSTQRIERFRKYDAEYTRRLLAKYFSAKSHYGGNIFDDQITIGDETIKTSRFPCLRTYAVPAVGFEEQCSNGSFPPEDTQASIPNGKHVAKT